MVINQVNQESTLKAKDDVMVGFPQLLGWHASLSWNMALEELGAKIIDTMTLAVANMCWTVPCETCVPAGFSLWNMIFHHSRGQLRNMVESYNGTFKSGDAVQIKDGIVHAGSTQQVTVF